MKAFEVIYNYFQKFLMKLFIRVQLYFLINHDFYYFQYNTSKNSGKALNYLNELY